MYPVILQIGPITIFSLWIMIAIGFFAALLVLNKLANKNRLKLNFITDHSLVIFFSGLIFARIAYVLANFNLYFQNPNLNNILRIFYIWDRGLSVWGGILGLTLSLVYFARINNENTLRWLDIFVVSILSALVFGNIGAFLDGINYGRETSLPWGVIIDNSLYTVPIHPTQIYAALYCLLITIVLFNLFNHKIAKNPGQIAIIGSGLYSFFRFLEEFLRGDESNLFFGMREAQICALLGIIISAILFYVTNRINNNLTNQPDGNAQ